MPDWKKVIFVACHVALVALIAHQCWRFYLLFSEPFQSDDLPFATDQNISVEGLQRADVEKLVQSRLFGEIGDVMPDKPQVNIEQAQPSTRAYRIASIAYRHGGGQSSAILEVTPGEMVFFRSGEAVEPGVLLKSVKEDAILLEANGRAERIDYVKVRRPVLIRVKKGVESTERSEMDDWSWVVQWSQLSDNELLKKLGLALIDGQYVVMGNSPLLANWNIAASDRLLSVNGRVLSEGEDIGAVLMPLSVPGTVSLLLENPRRRLLVRWERKM